MRPGANGTVTSDDRQPSPPVRHAALPREHDQVGERDLLAAALTLIEFKLDALQSLEHLGKLLGLVGFPVLLRRKANARAIGAAALVAAAERRSRSPRGQTSSDTLRPEASTLALSAAASALSISG